MSDTLIVRVALDHPLASLYDYRWLDAAAPRVGQLVAVPFGRRSLVGLIYEIAGHSEVGDARLRDVELACTAMPPLSAAWCELIAAQRRATPALACRLLLHHHERAVTQDYAQDYADEIDALHRRLAPLAQARPRQQAVNRRCPHCDLLSLVAVDRCGTRCTNPDCGATPHRTEDHHGHRHPGALATA